MGMPSYLASTLGEDSKCPNFVVGVDRTRSFILLVGVSPGTWASEALPRAATCTDLRIGRFADAKITTAELIPRGALKLSGEWGAGLNSFLRKLPAFCRVIGVLRPTTDSNIGCELLGRRLSLNRAL